MLEHIDVIRKALVTARFEAEHAMMYDEPTDRSWMGDADMVARIDATLAALDAPLSKPVPATVPPPAVLDAMGRCMDTLLKAYAGIPRFMPDQLFEDYVDVRAWLNEQPVGFLNQQEKS